MNPHNKRRTGLTALVAATLLVAGACSSNDGGGGGGSTTGAEGEPVKGGTLNMLGSGDVDYVDQNISYYSIGNQLLRMFARQLFANPAVEGKTTTAAPDLATEIPTEGNGGISKDGLTYTIKLRKGAKWDTSPPRDIVAGDVVRGVKRTCNPAQPFGGLPDYQTLIEGFNDFCDGFAKVAPNASAIAKYINDTDLPGVVAKDDYTVVFTLTHPATYFVSMLTMNAFDPAPEEILDYVPASTKLGQNQVASGPYKIDSYEPTKSIVLSRNPAWDASTDPIRKAYVDKIVINETVSQESTQQQLQTGTASADMEFNNFPPPSQLNQLIASKDPNLNLGSTDSSNPYIWFNQRSPNNNKAMANVKVRQALEYAINRDNIIQVLGGPQVNTPLTHVIPKGIQGSQDFDLYPYDTDKAKQLLQEAGYDKGFTIKYLYNSDSEGAQKTFATVQQDLSKVGIKLTGVPSPSADLFTKYLQSPSVADNGTWDMTGSGWGPDWYGNAALSYFGPLFNGKAAFPPIGSNFGFYESSKTDALIEKASTATDIQESLDAWAAADKQVMEDAAFFPITEPTQANYHADQVNNAVYLSAIQNFDPTNVWLDENKQGG
jgi:peptide/nickel transport system substrate-binding protein